MKNKKKSDEKELCTRERKEGHEKKAVMMNGRRRKWMGKGIIDEEKEGNWIRKNKERKKRWTELMRGNEVNGLKDEEKEKKRWKWECWRRGKRWKKLIRKMKKVLKRRKVKWKDKAMKRKKESYKNTKAEGEGKKKWKELWVKK